MIDHNAAYLALTARDVRFDGVFFVGVISTGIYCRPICPVKPPRQENCRFFNSAEAAEQASFRPCLRCRPELAPGNAPVDNARRVAELLIQRLDEGLITERANMQDIATQFAISPRQLRRIVQQELGVSPFALKQTRRLLLAKQLLSETRLSVTEVAFASGFSSLRRFNDVFNSRYRMPPSRLRQQRHNPAPALTTHDTSCLQLCYRPPYDWPAMLEFLRLRALNSVEWVEDDSYARTVRLGPYQGWIKVTHAKGKPALQVEFTHSLTGALPTLLRRLRNLFDLNAHPMLIDGWLQQDPRLSASIRQNPGLRVPGAFDGFEMTIRAILGQQITVKAATTLGGRFAVAFGEHIETPFPALSQLAPLAERMAMATVDDIAALGIVSARARCIIALAQACASGKLILEGGTDPEGMIRQLLLIPGIGPWTTQYIAMRALRWPDAFPASDIAVRKNLGGVSTREAEALSHAWQPWRSYAVLHIWKNLPARDEQVTCEPDAASPERHD